MYSVKVGIIGGSGLNNPDLFKDGVSKKVSTRFGEPSDVLVEGTVGEVPCVLLSRHGRHHTISPSHVNYRANICALQDAGCTHILAATACGSLREDIRVGDFVLLNSFIDRTKRRVDTFYDGSPEGLKGICHLDMCKPFCLRTRSILKSAAEHLGITCHKEGTVVLAREAGICYAAVAMVTDYDCWQEASDIISVDSVLAVMKKNAMKVLQIFNKAVPMIAEENWTETLSENKKLVSICTV